MLAVQRQEIIQKAVQNEGSLSIQTLIDLLGVSRETVRRDIASMADRGLITKVHGGIVANAVGLEPAYGERAIAHAAEKARIAEGARIEVMEGQTLYLDSGTTVVELVRLLPVGLKVQVFTNSLVIAEELVNKQIATYVLGGSLRAGELSLSGAFAQDMARAVHVDRAYFGAGGLSLQYGVMDYHMEEAVLRRIIGEQAAEVVILADSSKYGMTGVVRVFEWQQVTEWITDDHLDPEIVELLRANSVKVVRC